MKKSLLVNLDHYMGMPYVINVGVQPGGKYYFYKDSDGDSGYCLGFRHDVQFDHIIGDIITVRAKHVRPEYHQECKIEGPAAHVRSRFEKVLSPKEYMWSHVSLRGARYLIAIQHLDSTTPQSCQGILEHANSRIVPE